MSKYELQVMLDRKDRTYRFNEEVSGKVVLDTQAQLTCQTMWISYGWRTHGKGNQDDGGGRTLDLISKEVQFRSGGHREYPFRFKAPNGPVTYHGHVLNVDWYVTAHLITPSRPKIKKETDFLLFASDAPKQIILGDSRKPKDVLSIRAQDVPIILPVYPDIQPGNPPKIPPIAHVVGGLAWFFLFVLWILPVLGSINILAVVVFFGGPIVASSLYFHGLPVILNTNWKRNIEIIDLRVAPSDLYPGDRVTCRLQFQTKRNIYLDHVAATVYAEEVAVNESGSDRNEYKHGAYKESFVKSYNENLAAGRFVSFDCALPVLPGAPATFASSHNDIKWSVKLIIKYHRVPAWEKTIPIRVLPK